MSVPLSKKYLEKTQALHTLCAQLGFSLLDLVDEKYSGTCFPETGIEKTTVFRQILEAGVVGDEEARYLDEVCGGLTWFRDRRTGVEYASDLVIGWAAEDAVLLHLERSGVTAVLSGHDRYREFLPPLRISTQPDIFLTDSEGEGRMLELMNDWKKYWEKQDSLELRDNKFQKLCDEDALFVGLAPLSKKGLFLDLREHQSEWEHIPAHHPYGGKPAWSLSPVSGYLCEYDEVFSRLFEALKGGE